MKNFIFNLLIILLAVGSFTVSVEAQTWEPASQVDLNMMTATHVTIQTGPQSPPVHLGKFTNNVGTMFGSVRRTGQTSLTFETALSSAPVTESNMANFSMLKSENQTTLSEDYTAVAPGDLQDGDAEQILLGEVTSGVGYICACMASIPVSPAPGAPSLSVIGNVRLSSPTLSTVVDELKNNPNLQCSLRAMSGQVVMKPMSEAFVLRNASAASAAPAGNDDWVESSTANPAALIQSGIYPMSANQNSKIFLVKLNAEDEQFSRLWYWNGQKFLATVNLPEGAPATFVNHTEIPSTLFFYKKTVVPASQPGLGSPPPTGLEPIIVNGSEVCFRRNQNPASLRVPGIKHMGDCKAVKRDGSNWATQPVPLRALTPMQ